MRQNTHVIQGDPKKVSHFQKSSLNRIKNRHFGYISHQFKYKMSTRML